MYHHADMHGNCALYNPQVRLTEFFGNVRSVVLSDGPALDMYQADASNATLHTADAGEPEAARAVPKAVVRHRRCVESPDRAEPGAEGKDFFFVFVFFLLLVCFCGKVDA
jgi:hypothetical protein